MTHHGSITRSSATCLALAALALGLLAGASPAFAKSRTASCGTVTSASGAFVAGKVRATGLSCASARTKLRSWTRRGAASLPHKARSWHCSHTGKTAWRCRNRAASATFTLSGEKVAPTITLAAPGDGARYAAGASVNAAYVCSDNVAVASCTGTVPNGAALPTGTAGSFSFTVTAKDEAGNVTSRSVGYTVFAPPAPAPPADTPPARDTTAPVVDFRTPRDGATYELGGTVNADYGCADNVGVTACTGSVANGAAIALDTLGAHTLSVTARDAAGNVATKQVTYTVKDTTAPTVSISSPTAGATFAWGQSATAGYSCADLALASCTATVGTASVANRGALPTTGAPGPGTRTLVVKATDASGNVTTQQAQYTVSPAGYYALTYDDGPNGIYTKPVLDALQSVNAKATFFVVGLSVQSFPELMRDIVSRGNWVENHTMTHTNLGPDDTDPATPKHGFNAAGQPEDPAAEISGLNDLIKQYTGAAPQFLRPPYGMYDQSTVDLAAQYGLTITNWTIDTNDWQGLSATQVVNNAMAVKPGGIILMHDAAQNTVTATPMIVNQLRDQKGMLPGKLAYSATPQFIVDWEDAGGGLGFHAMAVAP